MQCGVSNCVMLRPTDRHYSSKWRFLCVETDTAGLTFTAFNSYKLQIAVRTTAMITLTLLSISHSSHRPSHRHHNSIALSERHATGRLITGAPERTGLEQIVPIEQKCSGRMCLAAWNMGRIVQWCCVVCVRHTYIHRQLNLCKACSITM